MRIVVVALALIGCKKEEPFDAPPGALVDMSAAVGVDVQSGIGPVGHGAVARAVNDVGAAVPSGPLPVTVGEVQQQITFDATGIADLSLPDPGSAEVTAAMRPAWVHTTGDDWPGFGLPRADNPLATARFAAGIARGWLVAGLDDVWYVPPPQPGSPGTPWPVMRLAGGAQIYGLSAAHIDEDGVLDAIAWGGDTVVLLKGRVNGGAVWGATIQAEGAAVTGAAVGDVDDDGSPDVAIAWADQTGENSLEVLLGDGQFGFEPMEKKALAELPGPIAIGDNSAAGTPQVTVLIGNGEWQRFTVSGGVLVETGPTLATLFPTTQTLLSGADMNADGGDELVFLGPVSPGQDRDVRVYDLVGAQPTFLPLTPPAAEVALADVDADGSAELTMVYEDHQTVELRWNGTGFTQHNVGSVAGYGPPAMSVFDADRVPTLLVADEDRAWAQFDAESVPDEEDIPWLTPIEPVWEAHDGAFLGPSVAIDTDADPGTLEFVGVSGGDLERYTVTTGVPSTLTATRLTAVAGSAITPLDLAVCSNVAWVLTADTVYRVPFVGGATSAAITGGARLDCGLGPSGAAAAVLQTNGDVVLLNGALGTVDTLAAVGGADVALVTTADGDEALTCADAGCNALRWEYADDGRDAFVWTDGTGTHAELDDGDRLDLGMAGWLSIGDADADGNPDLLIVSSDDEGAVILVVRSTGEGFGPAEGFHSRQILAGPALTGDADGDGTPDVWAPTTTGDLMSSPPVE
jgi:hypothetical protein